MSLELDAVERRTYPRHALSTLLDSTFTTMCWSGADVAVKGFDASTFVVTLVTMAPGLCQSLSVVLARPMARVGRRRLLRAAALLGRLPMLLVYFVDGPLGFLLLLIIQSVAQVIITTSWNSLLRSNYRGHVRGALYAKAARFGAFAQGVVAIGAGFWLYYDHSAFRYIYPGVAVLGVVACLIFAEIDVRSSAAELEDVARHDSVRALFAQLIADRRFLRYEVAFFCYGIGFMSAMTATPLRFARSEQLAFSYAVLLGAKGVFAFSILLASVAMGRRMDRLGPAGMATRCFFLLALYGILLAVATTPLLYFLAMAVFGVAMSGVMIAWNMGPVTLAPTSSAASNYMVIHVGLVGARSLIGHPLGGAVSELTGDPRWAFAISVMCFATGAIVMRGVARPDSEV